MAKTVFVIGAGASTEFGLPTGGELKGQIASMLAAMHPVSPFETPGPRDRLLDTAMTLANERLGLSAYQVQVAGRIIAKALPQVPSIDNYLHMQRGNSAIEMAGKLAIVACITRAECGSKLAEKEQRGRDECAINVEGLQNTWLTGFFKLLCAECAAEDLENRFKRVALVIFNYDRCVEHFLYHSLQNTYGSQVMPPERAAQLVMSLEIYHPYGQVGRLAWMHAGEDTVLAFGSTPPGPVLWSLANEIKTFTEGTDPSSSHILGIRAAVGSASRIVYVGFAYWSQNLELLYGRPTLKTRPCMGTSLGISERNTLAVRAALRDWGETSAAELHAETCSKFIEDFSMVLSFR